MAWCPACSDLAFDRRFERVLIALVLGCGVCKGVERTDRAADAMHAARDECRRRFRPSVHNLLHAQIFQSKSLAHLHLLNAKMRRRSLPVFVRGQTNRDHAEMQRRLSGTVSGVLDGPACGLLFTISGSRTSLGRRRAYGATLRPQHLAVERPQSFLVSQELPGQLPPPANRPSPRWSRRDKHVGQRTCASTRYQSLPNALLGSNNVGHQKVLRFRP